MPRTWPSSPCGRRWKERRRGGPRPAPDRATEDPHLPDQRLRIHTRDALEKGEKPDRIAVLPGWEETGCFSEIERAALRLTEAITRVSDGHVSDEEYNAAAAALTADQVSAIAWLTTVVNTFNRVVITSRFSVGS
ncbi:hypothetical protein GCM10009608_80760 [Pseudonocardia alaniniphila]